MTPPRLGRTLRAFRPRVVVAWMNRAARATPRGGWVKVGRLGGYYDLRYYRGCDHLVGNTRGIVAWIREQGWPGERVHHLPNFAPDLAGAAPAALPPGPMALALGRLHRNKGFDVLIRALPALPSLRLVLAGEGPERAPLQRLAQELGVAGRLSMPGWRGDQAGLLAACDVLVCPSRIEPLGNVVIEAFSAARPVVAAAVAGPLELIDPGRTGLLVPPEDPARLAAAIRTVLDDQPLAARLAAAGRAQWQAEHAEVPVVQRWRDAPVRHGGRLMCGIAGLAMAPAAPPPDATVLAALGRALAHRGPDGAGHSVVGRIALVHTRLAIIDLAGGDQPLFAGPAALVANAEVYNYRELRDALPAAQFATASDCEPPLHLWLRDGAAYAGALRGMFAIAIHERVQRAVTLTRDPFGIKPLYTAQVEGGLAFASEPQALLAAGLVERAVRPGALTELLQMQFTTGAATIFPGIDRVLPGESVRIADGHVLDRTRVPGLPEGGPEPLGEEAALTRLDHALMRSVDLHQRSDVPYGMFLSGGVDSSAILATMARLNNDRVLAFTAGFDAPGAADEREHAQTVARAANARHESIEITEDMVWRHLPEIVACMDDPAADYAIIPTWFLARRARQDVKVVLSGEGGDEIFAGYGRYRSAMRPWWQGGRVMRARGTFDKLDVLREAPVGWRDGLEAAEAQAALPGRTRLAVAQATDIADWLPHDLLLKLDRCLMANAVEGRTPFLDPEVAAAGFALPDGLKVRNGRGKYLLRRWLERAMPEALPFAPKQGFTVPIGVWIAQQGARLGPLVATQPGVAEIARADRVAALFRHATGKREAHAAWTLLFYALWHRAHILGLPAGGDVFEALAAT